MRMRVMVVVLLAVVTFVLFASDPSASQSRIIIAGAGVPGFFAYDLLNGLTQVLSRSVSGVGFQMEQSTGFLDVMQRIAAGRAHVGVVGSVIVLDAHEGEDVFRTRVPVRTLAVLHDFVYHLITLEDTGIRTLADLRGKRVGIGGAGDQRDALRWLRAAGLDPDRDVRRQMFQAPSEAALALSEKRIDALFTTAVGRPNVPEINELGSLPGVRLRIIPLDGILPGVRRQFGERYRSFTLRRGLYPGMAEDVRTISAGSYVIALDNLDPSVAYQITRHLYEKRGDLAQFSYAAQYITVNGAATRAIVPFHPGAVRYFRERGVSGF